MVGLRIVVHPDSVTGVPFWQEASLHDAFLLRMELVSKVTARHLTPFLFFDQYWDLKSAFLVWAVCSYSSSAFALIYGPPVELSSMCALRTSLCHDCYGR